VNASVVLVQCSEFYFSLVLVLISKGLLKALLISFNLSFW